MNTDHAFEKDGPPLSVNLTDLGGMDLVLRILTDSARQLRDASEAACKPDNALPTTIEPLKTLLNRGANSHSSLTTCDQTINSAASTVRNWFPSQDDVTTLHNLTSILRDNPMLMHNVTTFVEHKRLTKESVDFGFPTQAPTGGVDSNLVTSCVL